MIITQSLNGIRYKKSEWVRFPYRLFAVKLTEYLSLIAVEVNRDGSPVRLPKWVFLRSGGEPSLFTVYIFLKRSAVLSEDFGKHKGIRIDFAFQNITHDDPCLS